ncbi:MAG: NAD-dependent DNA ligase LigA [Promethearchaeia archaeon]
MSNNRNFIVPENIEKAKKRAKELREKIRFHDKKYYIENNPVISDYEYDQLMEDLKAIEEKYPDLVTEYSPTQRVGAEEIEEFKTVKHKAAMLSLDKVTDEDGLYDFNDRVKEAIKSEEVEYVVEPKIDGVGIALYYENKKLERGATRGNGEEGEEITPNLKTIHSIPLKLREESILHTGEFRGEVYMPKKEFKKMNKRREKQGKEPFANPRNAAAGTVRNKDPQRVAKRPLNAYLYTLSYWEEGGFKTHWECLNEMEKAGLRVNKRIKKLKNIEEVIKKIKEWKEIKDNLEYEIDGIVIKVNDLQAHGILGHTTHHPRWAIAYKYPPNRKTTKVQDISVHVGRTGKLTPIAILNPIQLSGTTVSRASLHNEDEIRRKDIRIKDTVLVEKAGEIIPQVVKVIKGKRTGEEKKFEMPKKCPICGSSAKRIGGEVVRRCLNSLCPAQVKQRIEHWGSRNAMNIEGLGPKLIDKLVEQGIVENIADIYELKLNDLRNIERMGEKSSNNLLEEIRDSKDRGLSKVLYGLGIPFVGEHLSNVLANHYEDIDQLMSARKTELENIDEVGPKIAESVVNFFNDKKNKGLIDQLKKHQIKMLSEQKEKKQFLDGKRFVFTGALERYTRAEASKKIQDYGGRVTSSVSGKTDYLVVGKRPGSKLNKAKKEGTPILQEKDFYSILEKETLP